MAGKYFEELEVGARFEHEPGRTVMDHVGGNPRSEIDCSCRCATITMRWLTP